MALRQLLTRVTKAFWAIPAACALIAALLAFALIRVDGLGDRFGVLYGGGPESARSILGVVASSVLTFAALTFSITMIALQLASSQFSPRVLNTLLRDRWTQGALGVFVGTFVFALLTLREVRGGPDAFVPGLAVSVTLVLALASIGTLMGFIHHMAQSLRVVTIIERIHHETRRALDSWYDDDRDPVGSARVVDGPRREVAAPVNGVLTWYGRSALAERAVEDDVTIDLLAPTGAWLCEGQAVLAVTGPIDDASAEALIGQLAFDRERETAHDPAYGFRQLVDIAERALSPGVNDPTTAVQCLDRMHALLRHLARRDLAVGETVVDGVARVRVPVPGWDDYVALSCDEIRHWAAGSVRVHRRMREMLRDLLEVVGPERQQCLREQLARLEHRMAEAAYEWEATSGGAGDPAERPEGRAPAQ